MCHDQISGESSCQLAGHTSRVHFLRVDYSEKDCFSHQNSQFLKYGRIPKIHDISRYIPILEKFKSLTNIPRFMIISLLDMHINRKCGGKMNFP